MDFVNLRIKDVEKIVSFSPRSKEWNNKNRYQHLVGIELSGKALHKIGGKELLLNKNDVFFLNQKDDYSVKLLCEPSEAKSFSIHFTTFEPIETDSFNVKAETPLEFINLLNKIEKKWLKKNGTLGLMSDVYKFCAMLYELKNKPYIQRDKKIIDAKEYINTNFMKKDCIEKTAKQYGVSRRRFNDIFKNAFGVLPKKYADTLCIDYATLLLAEKEFSVGEIAVLCGFNDVYYFSKFFRSKTGMSPLAYRKEISKDRI
ncbi:MAG: AraC family transcriptional regulator [Acutalibacteraceae bacterium]|nr:AraC family transcriptional regulator [Acutalibacteraceae bacterium]